MIPETPQYIIFFVSFGGLLDFGQNYFTFANPNLQLTYCNRHLIRRIKLYCYYLNNRIYNSLFGLWRFNLILITTSTNLQNNFYFIFLSKLNSEANPLVDFNVNITNKKHVSNKSGCVAAFSFHMFIYCCCPTYLGEISVGLLAAFFCLRRL